MKREFMEKQYVSDHDGDDGDDDDNELFLQNG